MKLWRWLCSYGSRAGLVVAIRDQQASGRLLDRPAFAATARGGFILEKFAGGGDPPLDAPA
jgi:hypothetical protein